jgi:RNA polymerase sigma factor (sigma-70 family)
MNQSGDEVKHNAPASDARDDEWIVVRCQLGERSAFDELIERWNEPLWKYVRRVTNDDTSAPDILQDVWVRVLRGIHRIREGAKLRAWLFGIAHRTLMDHWRRKYAIPTVSELDAGDLAEDDPATELEEDFDRMERELAQLPVTEREVLTLFYLRELSLAEVAEVTHVPVGTVKSRLFRARQQLRAALESKGRDT